MAELIPSEVPEIFTEDELFNLRSIKLSNGHDILGCILSLDATNVIVKRPCQILKLVEDGNAIVVLTKWQQYSMTENHVINFSAVVSYCKVTPEMTQFYITNVKKQIASESKPQVETSVEYVWPEWMSQPLAKNQIN